MTFFRSHIITITAILFLIGFFPLFSNAQEVSLDKKITLVARNKPLSEVLGEISKLGDIHFAYSNERIPLDQHVTVIAHRKTIKKILDELLTDISIEYKVVEKQIILIPVNKDETVALPKDNKKYTISGYVKDKENGEDMIGANIFIKDAGVGTVSNAYGFYSLTLPQGEYTLNYSFIGYRAHEFPVDLKENKRINIEMEADKTILKEVEVKVTEKETTVEQVQMSEMKVNPATLKQMPGFLGEVELIKSLQSFPGIKSYGDGSASFFVRGGNRDQNMILIDEAPVYNPSHLLGFFTTFVPDAIKDINIYKGDIPSQLGDGLSSVIDIKTRDGNMKKFHGSGGIGFITNKICVEGPILKDKSSYFISWRSSHLEWLYKRQLPTLTLFFFDFNSKFNIRLNDNNRLFLSCYAGRDKYKNENESLGSSGINWGNFAGTLRWNHIFNNRLFSNTTFYTSKYDYLLYINFSGKDYWTSNIVNASIKTDMTWYPDPSRTVRGGIRFSAHSFNPGNIVIQSATNIDLPNVPMYYSNSFTSYLSLEQELSAKLSFRAGLRCQAWNNTGPTTVYLYDQNHNPEDTLVVKKDETYTKFFNLEPRLNLTYQLNEKSSLKASYNRTVQYIHWLSNSASPFTTLEVWIPSGPNVLPEKADQVAAGYFLNFSKKNLIFSVESFYKFMKNQIDYEDHAKMLLNPHIEGELRFGESWSYGVEFMLKKPEGRLNGWIAYTLSKTERQINGINKNKKFRTFYDRPHDVTVFLCFNASSRWNLSANWTYYTGSAITTPTSFYYLQGYTVPVYDEKNNDRLPDYHRLDVSAVYKLNKQEKRYSHSLLFTIYNVYGRKNPIAVYFNKTISVDGHFRIPANLIAQPEMIPTMSFLFSVIPSVTYTFKF